MRISTQQLVAVSYLAWGCGSHAESQGSICPGMHAETKAMGGSDAVWSIGW